VAVFLLIHRIHGSGRAYPAGKLARTLSKSRIFVKLSSSFRPAPVGLQEKSKKQIKSIAYKFYSEAMQIAIRLIIHYPCIPCKLHEGAA
jgi:hypothetical protein